jgi:sigma-E factor negative regulatory protein RseC
MLTEKALVTAVDNTHVWLEPRQSGYCGKCSMNKGCGHYLLANLRKNRNQPIKARLAPTLDSRNIQQGDLVTVGIEETDLIKLSSLFYGLPLLLLVMSALFAMLAGFSEFMVLVCTVISLCLGISLSRKLVTGMEERALIAVQAEGVDNTEPLKLVTT